MKRFDNVPRVAVATLCLIAASSTRLAQTEQLIPSQQPNRMAPRPSPPLIIGWVSFRLGMSRQEAMSLIAECCLTVDLSSDAIFLQDKASHNIIGKLFFKSGRVSALTRDEKQSQDRETSDFALALYRSVLGRNTTLESSSVALSVFPQELSNGTQRHLALTLPDGRRLRVTQANLDNGQTVVDLTEER